MNILIVTPGFPSIINNSISSKFVLYEAKAYAKNGANVTVVTPHYPGVPSYEEFEYGIKVYRFTKPSIITFLSSIMCSNNSFIRRRIINYIS